jgi:hypothetical protein
LKVLSLLTGVLFLALTALNLVSPFWIIACLFTAYTCFCSFRDYYNPMLLSLMCIAYLISFARYFPGIKYQNWVLDLPANASVLLPFTLQAGAAEAILAVFAVLVNFRLMQIGLIRAKKPGYNRAYSITENRHRQSNVS